MRFLTDIVSKVIVLTNYISRASTACQSPESYPELGEEMAQAFSGIGRVLSGHFQ